MTPAETKAWRIARIVAALQNGHPTIQELAKGLKVNPRTIKQDFATLRKAGVKISYLQHNRRWTYKLRARA